MTRDQFIVGAIAVASVPVLLFIGAHLLARIARRYGTDHTPMSTHTYRFTGMDEDLRRRTEEKRRIADQIRAKSLRVESGARSSDFLRRVK